MKQKNIKGKPLDLLEASYYRCQIPIIYCNITFKSNINLKRLKKAIFKTKSLLPEILYAYNVKHNRWFDLGFTIDDIFIDKNLKDYRWNLTNSTQLKIFIINKKTLKIAISHILTDGGGFKEYLYLLCDNYNNNRSFEVNNRNSEELLEKISKFKINKTFNYKLEEINIPVKDIGNDFFSIKKTIKKEQFIKLKMKAKLFKVTVNDIILGSYVKTLFNITKKENITITCPVNLRQFLSNDRLRICNHTGIYNCVFNIKRKDSIFDVINKVHHEMLKQKEEKDYLYKLKLLHNSYKYIPKIILKKFISKLYVIPKVSYTNIGIIDKDKLFFEDNKIISCYMTNTYKKFPSIQMAVSTYNDNCILSCNIIGSLNNYYQAKNILESTKKYCIMFLGDNNGKKEDN